MATALETENKDDLGDYTKPPFLRRVRIRGYKSIAFCDVSLQPLTILVGRNAAGKSNFLDALAFLRDVFVVGVNEASKRHGGYEAIPCRACPASSVLIEIEFGYTIADDADLWTGMYSIEIEFPKKRAAKIRHEVFRLQQDKWWVAYSNNNGKVTCSAADDGPTEREWKITDHPFLDNYHDTPVPEFHEALAAIATYNFQPDAMRPVQKPLMGVLLEKDGRNLASVIRSLKENDPDSVMRVRDYLSNIAEEVESFEVVPLGEYETIRFRLRASASGSTLEFDAASMSDGTLRALASLVAAFQMVLPHGNPAVVGIEEPEASLHPAAMRALVDALDEATTRTQVLLTTHSAEMLDNPTIRPKNLLVVQMIAGQTRIGPVDEATIDIVRRKLDTLGGLERENQLEPNLDDMERQRQLSLAQEGTPS